MIWLQNGILLLIGLCGGLLVSGGLFAFLALAGVVTRLAAGTTTAKHAKLYEDMALLGCTAGNLLYVLLRPCRKCFQTLLAQQKPFDLLC